MGRGAGTVVKYIVVESASFRIGTWATVASLLLHVTAVTGVLVAPPMRARSDASLTKSSGDAPMYADLTDWQPPTAPPEQQEPVTPDTEPAPVISPQPTPLPPPPSPPKPVPINLGKDNGRPDSPNWIDSTQPGLQGAPEGEQEQPLLRKTAPSGGGNGDNGGNGQPRAPDAAAKPEPTKPSEPVEAAPAPTTPTAPTAPVLPPVIPTPTPAPTSPATPAALAPPVREPEPAVVPEKEPVKVLPPAPAVETPKPTPPVPLPGVDKPAPTEVVQPPAETPKPEDVKPLEAPVEPAPRVEPKVEPTLGPGAGVVPVPVEKPTEVKPAEVKPAEIKPGEIKPAEVTGPVDPVKSPLPEPAEVPAPIAEPAAAPDAAKKAEAAAKPSREPLRITADEISDLAYAVKGGEPEKDAITATPVTPENNPLRAPGTAPAVPAAPAATPVAPAAEAAAKPGKAGAPGTPIEQSEDAAWIADKESDPTSLRRTARYESGRVEAGEGLEILTVNPSFDAATRNFSLPRSPVFEIKFDRNGEVKRLRMLRSSGFPNVNEPIKNAMFKWRARGKALDELPNEPDAGVVLRITIRLR